jgi:SAM-dependent methyltransferase
MSQEQAAPYEPLPKQLHLTRSSICRQADFMTDDYTRWCAAFKQEPFFHRKQWEYVYILRSLSQRGMLAPGKRGLGFAVGTEPIPAVLTSLGCEVVATDIDPAIGEQKGWTTGDQLCRQVEDLNKPGICPPDQFRKLCRYRPVDMNDIPADLRNFDFNWSSCSFEHLGSIEKGLVFLRNQLATLKPGGIAVHTTEFNLSSNDETLETDNCVAFRQRDIDKVVAELRAGGHEVAELDYSLGWLPHDYKVDTPPWGIPHLRLKLGHFVCTSIGIVITKQGSDAGPSSSYTN